MLVYWLDWMISESFPKLHSLLTTFLLLCWHQHHQVHDLETFVLCMDMVGSLRHSTAGPSL